MTKLERFERKTGMKQLATSNVWNYHSIDSLFNVAMRSNSNLNATLKELFKTYKGNVTLIVGCIGRSAHSATEIGIYEGITNLQEYSKYYSKGCDEIFIERFSQFFPQK